MSKVQIVTIRDYYKIIIPNNNYCLKKRPPSKLPFFSCITHVDAATKHLRVIMQMCLMSDLFTPMYCHLL